jgi:hypothetical protein
MGKKAIFIFKKFILKKKILSPVQILTVNFNKSSYANSFSYLNNTCNNRRLIIIISRDQTISLLFIIIFNFHI